MGADQPSPRLRLGKHARVRLLFALFVNGGRHAAENLPRAVRPDPGVRDPHCVCSHYLAGVAAGPVRFDSIMIDGDVTGT